VFLVHCFGVENENVMMDATVFFSFFLFFFLYVRFCVGCESLWRFLRLVAVRGKKWINFAVLSGIN